ncbi:MAG: 2-dehydropantoate 2-reductase [Naasia sp.]
MRIGVVGAGAVGGTLAALLDRAGHEVAVAARGGGLDAIRTHGLRLEGAWGAHTASVAAAEIIDSPVELLIIAVKAPDLAGAVAANRAAVGGPVLVVRNGLGAREETRRALGGTAPVVGGLAVFAASLAAPGTVTVTAAAPLYVGGHAAAEGVAEVLGAVLPTRVADPFDGAEWTKLVVNQVNALPAITGLSVQACIADATLRRILTRSIRETVDTARATGIRFARLQGLDDRLLGLVASVPEVVAEGLPRLMARRMGDVPNPGSTLQSVRRGRPTEIDWLNGAVVDTAVRAGRSAPVNAALVELVHEVERTGRFLTPAEVRGRL